MWIIPVKKVVFSVLKLTLQMKSAKIKSTASVAGSPKVNPLPVTRLAAATAGIVKPIVAQAEPIATFKPRCSSLLSEARTAEMASGIKTIPAINAPTMLSVWVTW